MTYVSSDALGGASTPDSVLVPRDPRADSRYAHGKAAIEDGAPGEAADLFEQALTLAPGWIGAWMALAEARRRLGDHDAARAGYDRALALDPHDRHGAELARAGLADAATPTRAPAAYVATLFDDYAARFEHHLTDGLSYTGPADLLAALRAAGFTHAACAADLGCGTGLFGAVIRPAVDTLAGVDLSPRMIARAARKAWNDRPLYDRLVVGDLHAFMASEPAATLDLVVAADVFIYLGDLAPIFAAAARAMRSDALLAFTVQSHEGPAAYAVGADLRFVHTSAYLAARLADAGFVIVHESQKSARREKGRDVPGLVVVARRR